MSCRVRQVFTFFFLVFFFNDTATTEIYTLSLHDALPISVISGAFALVQQAIQLGAVPRLEVRQTSEETAVQVYLPHVNWLLAAAVLALVLGFRSSEALANAYGIAVAGDMLVTMLLMVAVARGH